MTPMGRRTSRIRSTQRTALRSLVLVFIRIGPASFPQNEPQILDADDPREL
jgi:hypothetical protein